MKRNAVAVAVTIMVLFTVALAFGEEVKGIISGRTGDILTVKGSAGSTSVVLTDETKVKDDRGLFGLEKQHLAETVLIPGLKIKVDGSTDSEGRFIATTITTDGDDLESSEMIQAGLQPTADQVAANVAQLAAHKETMGSHQEQLQAHTQDISVSQQNITANKEKIQGNLQDIQEHTQRFMALADYDVKAQGTVNFAVGSSTLTKKAQQDLKNFAQNAAGIKGYIVEVMGYADSTGGAAMNTNLSEDRAKAVMTYLVQQCGIPPRHIVAPGAMGEYGSAAPNETKAGRAANRRVEFKVLVNKGISGA
jgi:OOP family OmpA-OmpF porin